MVLEDKITILKRVTLTHSDIMLRSDGIVQINYASEAHFTEKHHNKHFLLIDDVMTTGATLEAAGKALLEIPDAKISIVCMAMSHS